MMSITDYARLVASMRRAQREAQEWQGDPAAGRAARGWEKQVDAATAEILMAPKLPFSTPTHPDAL